MEEPVERDGLLSVELPGTRYRKLVHCIITYLKQNKDSRESFKALFYDSIPTRIWDENVVEWLIKMEQSDLFNIQSMDCLAMFFECIDEPNGRAVLRRIRVFQWWMRTIQLLMDGVPQGQGKWLYLSCFKRVPVEVSQELHEQLQQWRKRLREPPKLTCFHIRNVYSYATQRIAQTATVSTQSDADVHRLEAIVIADFLMKELSSWFLNQTDLALEKAFGGCEVKRLL